MIIIKNGHEIEAMRQACRITAAARALAGEMVRPGVTTRQIDKAVHDYIVSQGAKPSFLGYHGFPASTCVCVNNVVVHGIPSGYTLKEGDIVSIDVERNEAIYAYVSGYQNITVGKVKFASNAIGLNYSYTARLEKVNGSETIIQTNNFAKTLKASDGTFYGTLIDGGDGYIWGFQHKDNAKGNSDGIANILWVRINKTDWTLEEGEWNINAPLLTFGEYGVDIGTSSTNTTAVNYAIIENNVLYAIKYNANPYIYGVYSIPLDNITDVKFMPIEGATYRDGAINADGYENGTAVNNVGGAIQYRGCFISGGKLIAKHNAKGTGDLTKHGCLYRCGKPGIKYGPYIFGIGVYYNSGVAYVSVIPYLQSCYLATINNLQTPVEKTADKTMKITYILREES